MAESRLRIPLDASTSATARRFAPAAASETLFLYAPGAGSNIDDAFGVYLCQALALHDIEAWLFQFLYMEAGRRAPDRTPVLEATWRAAIATARARNPTRLVIGGRSMGGRIASLVAAAGVPVDALVLFAYPLIPPGRAANDRSAHLSRISVPTLFCSGTRDSFATSEQLREATALVPEATLHLLEGADHGFAVLKASRRDREAVFAEATSAALDFIRGLDSARP